jgi:hypothetical protein
MQSYKADYGDLMSNEEGKWAKIDKTVAKWLRRNKQREKLVQLFIQ